MSLLICSADVKNRAFCLAEDREIDEVGLRLALVTLRLHQPDDPVYVFRPKPSEAFTVWLKDFPQVTLIPSRPPGGESWNCKPQALLHVLDLGFSEVIWLDADIALSKRCDELFDGLAPEVIVVVEEQVGSRSPAPQDFTSAWNLPVARAFPTCMNSCVVRVTENHRPLLKRWIEFFREPDYIAAKKLSNRPIHLHGDQSLLNALLASAEFADIPVRYLRRGLDVIHCGGAIAYTPSERLAGLFRCPPFFHGQGAKPWVMFRPDANYHGRFWIMRRLLQEVSPYFALARKHRRELGLPTPWLDRPSPAGIALRMLGCGHYALRGLPLALMAKLARSLSKRSSQ
jgi:hypothetical protein